MRKICLIGILLCAVMISSTSPAFAAADWVWMYSDHLGTRYVDNNSIRRDYNQSGYVFHAFIRYVYTDIGREQEIRQMQKQGRTFPPEIQNLASMVELQNYRYDNGIKYCATSTMVFYDHNGSMITNFTNNRPKWTIITSGTVEEVLFDNIRARVPN